MKPKAQKEREKVGGFPESVLLCGHKTKRVTKCYSQTLTPTFIITLPQNGEAGERV